MEKKIFFEIGMVNSRHMEYGIRSPLYAGLSPKMY